MQQTVLVVDDEPIVRDVVVRYLERDGFRTLTASDGDVARALIEERELAARVRTVLRRSNGSSQPRETIAFGEQDTRYRFASTVILHDGLMYVSLFLVVGHLYLTLIHPATRHSLRGMTLGNVNAEWADRHHSKWRPE